MLEHEGGKREHVVGGFASLSKVAVGVPDEVGDFLDVGSLDPLVHFLGKLTSGGLLTSFVEDDAEGAFGFLDEPF